MVKAVLPYLLFNFCAKSHLVFGGKLKYSKDTFKSEKYISISNKIIHSSS
ncbi:hypothetical protein JCM31739_14600 [Faecalimonas canis]